VSALGVCNAELGYLFWVAAVDVMSNFICINPSYCVQIISNNLLTLDGTRCKRALAGVCDAELGYYFWGAAVGV
jgi:hypothetical protein